MQGGIYMSKWEDKYNQYKDGGIDNVISELTSKGISTKEEKKEYRKLTKIKEKMSQIENIIEYREKLKAELAEFKKEDSAREKLDKASKRREELSKEIEGYQKRYEEIVKELRNSKLEPDEKSKLEDEKNKINTKMPKAQDEMDKQEEILKSGLGKKREKVDLSKEEIEAKKIETQTKISKCNLVAKNLLNGLNWEQIDIKLDNWKDKKFTSKDDKLAKDIESTKKARQERVEEFKKDKDTEEMVDLMDFATKHKDIDSVYSEKLDYNKPALTFAHKHPRLAKIGEFFKGLKDRFSREKDEEIDIEEMKEEKPDIEHTKKEEKSFREYIKEIAEKGINGVEAEEKAARQKAAKEKLEKMRKANRETEEKKFGKDYTERYNNESEKDDGAR